MDIIKIPETLADRYRGCGTALAAIKDGTIVDLVYIRDISPDADDSPESLWRLDVELAVETSVRSAALKLLKAGDYVLAGMVSAWEFAALRKLTPPPGATTVLLDPGNSGEPGTLWSHDEANSAWRTEIRVADNSFNIIIGGGHPEWEDVSATCEVLIHRLDGSPPVPIHKSDEKNWMEARRLATVVMRVANAMTGA